MAPQAFDLEELSVGVGSALQRGLEAFGLGLQCPAGEQDRCCSPPPSPKPDPLNPRPDSESQTLLLNRMLCRVPASYDPLNPEPLNPEPCILDLDDVGDNVHDDDENDDDVDGAAWQASCVRRPSIVALRSS